MKLEKNISQLLYCHDCIIVPEFGGFVANYRTATVDEVRQMVHPPSKEVGFNKNLKRNDGLLVDHVAHSEAIDFDEAGLLIASEVQRWNATLDSGQRLELKGVGGLFYDRFRNLQFDPEKNTNYLTAAFGMGAVQLPELRNAPVEVPVEKAPEPEPVIVELQPTASEKEDKKVVMWPAIAASLVALVAFGFWLNTRSNVLQKGMAELSGLDPFKARPAPTYVPHDLKGLDLSPDDIEGQVIDPNNSYFNYSFNDHRIAENGRVVEWNKPEPAEAVNTNVVGPLPSERFHVVGGCFKEEENALGLIETLNALGYDPKLIDLRKGLYRVAVGSYQSKQQALRALAAVRKEHTPSAWLLVK